MVETQLVAQGRWHKIDRGMDQQALKRTERARKYRRTAHDR
jgi:hypothetical protein